MVVCLHLLVSWGFCGYLVISFVVYAACEFLVSRFSCSVFMLGIEDTKILCCHSHHLFRILYSRKIPAFQYQICFTIQRSNHLRASDRIWIQGYESSGLLIRRQLQPTTSWPLFLPLRRCCHCPLSVTFVVIFLSNSYGDGIEQQGNCALIVVLFSECRHINLMFKILFFLIYKMLLFYCNFHKINITQRILHKHCTLLQVTDLFSRQSLFSTLCVLHQMFEIF